MSRTSQIEEMRNPYKILIGKTTCKENTVTLDRYGRIILEWIFEKWRLKVWKGFN
jgi:hypothetical protein